MESSLSLRRSLVLSQALPIAVFVLLTALASRVVIPLSFSPVPITMQTFAVILSGLVLGSKKGAMAQMAFLALIATGMPLTAFGLSGPLAFISPTAGYLLAFVPAAYLSGLVAETAGGKFRYAVAGLLALIVIYTGGTALLACYVGGLPKAINLGVKPFILIDLFKAAIAVTIADRMRDSVGR